MVETEELVDFLRRGKTSEAEIRLRFDVCPRKLLKELVAIDLIYKTTNPTRYYATPINKVIKAKIKLREGGIIINPENAYIDRGDTLPLGKELEKSEFPINIDRHFDINLPKTDEEKEKFKKVMKNIWNPPKPKKEGWFKRLLKRNAKH